MSNIISVLFGALASVRGRETYSTQSVNIPEIPYNSTMTDEEAAAGFSKMLATLEGNLNTAVAKQTSSSFGYTPLVFNKQDSASYNYSAEGIPIITPSISGITSEIKNNKDSLLSTDEQIAQYLLDNYGGSKAEVIRNFSGVINLPPQAVAMQDMLFKQIISKLSSQVRNNIYNDYDASNLSYFTD